MDINYKSLSAEYIDSLTELDRLCFTVCWSKNMFESELKSNIAHYIIALYDENVIGYVGIQFVCGEGNITNIAVHPLFRKNGIATELMSRIFNFAKQKELDFVTLEVRASNSEAIKLYNKFGFEIVGERKNYYSDNHETAILMTKFQPYTN